MSKVIRDTSMLHPLLVLSLRKIKRDVIDKYKMPFALFETGRTHERQQMLISKGRTHAPVSKHVFNLESTPPLYAIAADIVYFDGRWSWNIRDTSIKSWYILLGNISLDVCPELKWGGMNRKSTNYTHFELRELIIRQNLDKYPCIL